MWILINAMSYGIYLASAVFVSGAFANLSTHIHTQTNSSEQRTFYSKSTKHVHTNIVV